MHQQSDLTCPTCPTCHGRHHPAVNGAGVRGCPEDLRAFTAAADDVLRAEDIPSTLFTLYVGGAEPADVLTAVVLFAEGHYGSSDNFGATATSATGLWEGAIERSTVLSLVLPATDAPDVDQLAADLCARFGQDTVLVTVQPLADIRYA